MWYTIQSSEDWLSKLAKEYLGNAQKWPEIYNMNKDIIGENPDVVKVGQTIWIPVGGKARPTTTAPTQGQNVTSNAPATTTNPNTIMMIAGGLLIAGALFMLLKKEDRAEAT